MPLIAQPLSYYDAQYYSGVDGKSNYRQGYNWDVFGGLFTVLAQWLHLMFPTATTFLDVGCATGLLVRGLRAEGLEAWGVDGSAWAIEHADPAARPFVTCKDLETLWLSQQYDVVTCLETLEHCVLAQLAQILPRLAHHTGQVFLATIPGPDMLNRRAWEEAAREPSHCTLESREWWAEKFAAAGFVYGPWQQLSERLLQHQLLVVKAGWQLYVRGVP